MAGLVALYSTELDVDHCEGLGCPLDVRPTVLVLLTEPRQALVVLGSRVAADCSDFLVQLRESEPLRDRIGNVAVEEYPSLDMLRAELVNRLSRRFDELNALFEAAAAEGIGQR